jgi:hypothetical protein
MKQFSLNMSTKIVIICVMILHRQIRVHLGYPLQWNGITFLKVIVRENVIEDPIHLYL